jgi:uncharacterized membrane protein YfcA
MMSDPLFLHAFSGLVVGFLVGLTGVGGGSLMTPILVLLFGIHATTAVGTDLLYAAATKTVGTAVHSAERSVDWLIVRRLALGSVPATAATLVALQYAGRGSASVTHTITYVLGIALVLTAFSVFFRGWILRTATKRIGIPTPERAAVLTVVCGVVLGVLVSLSSVGAGALGVTVLLLLYPHVPLVRIVGSDIAHAVPLTLIAGLGHWAMGDVNWGLFGGLLLGSIPGIIAGSLLASHVPERGLRPILAGVLLFVGGRLVF